MGAVEVKLNPSKEDEGAGSLLRFASTIDTVRMNPPSFLAVITGSGYAHTRPTGCM